MDMRALQRQLDERRAAVELEVSILRSERARMQAELAWCDARQQDLEAEIGVLDRAARLGQPKGPAQSVLEAEAGHGMGEVVPAHITAAQRVAGLVAAARVSASAGGASTGHG